ncbi:hypothetical protein SAMN04489724_3024 [Algoriphagus locisalis]|uniref:Phage abortive infection protein n=1 Tax=Algoriphagus locisalis TaxID=305507 RepID=A0A1I7CAY7_9BACT|nr:hypothetical protein [Algoriphagus locisalis]SFT96601.1 hypothetical protein SAMN04489724_3024 [Algoriphagus locisalis]
MESSTAELISSVILGIVASGIAIHFSLKGKKMEEDRFMKELFQDFNARYDKLNNSLIKISMLDPRISVDDFRKKTKLYNDLIDYFNLCAEEYYWFREERIRKKVWKSWKAGMDYWYENLPILRVVWEEEIKGNGRLSYYLDREEKDFFSRK